MTRIIESSGDFLDKNTSEKMRTDQIEEMLEEISKEMAPQYYGKLKVERYGGEFEMMFDPSFLYLEEQKPGKRVLGIFHTTEKKIVFAVMEGFYYAENGGKAIRVLLNDNKIEPIVKKHLEQYVRKADVNEVHLQRGF